MKKVFIALMMFAVLFTGCATIDTNPAARITIQYSILRFIGDSPEKQTEALRLVQDIKGYVDQSQEVSIDALAALATEWIPWERLHPADRFLLAEIMIAVSNHLKEQVGSGVIEAEALVELGVFLDWLERAILMAS